MPCLLCLLVRALGSALGVQLPLPTLKEQMIEGYGDQISDPSTYKSMLNTNASLMWVVMTGTEPSLLYTPYHRGLGCLVCVPCVHHARAAAVQAAVSMC
jgi:hypothetical protein